MKKKFFEAHEKLILIFVNLFFVALFIFVLSLDILQDAPGAEEYSIIDRAVYQIRCGGKRNIVMRENHPNENSFRNPPYNKGAKYAFNVDENGFVKPSKIHENPDIKIFFLGGSTTESEMVEEVFRFPYLTGRILEEKTHKKINSYNAGKSGNNTIHSLNNLVNKIIPMKPDIVIRMESINDLSTLLYEGSYWNRNASRSNIGCFSKNTDLLRKFRNEWEKSPYVNLIYDEEYRKKIRAEHRQILELFIAITKAAKATPVLATQFNRIENNLDFTTGHGDKKFNEIYRQLYADFNEITRQVAKENNVLLIDLARAIKPEEKYIYDAVHVTDEGSKIVAQTIANKLIKIIK